MEIELLKEIAWLFIQIFGGMAAILIVLFTWLGNLWSKRILQTHKGAIESELAEIRHELALKSQSYSQHLELIVDYYDQFWKHYQLCRRAALTDAIRDRISGEMTNTKQQYIENLEKTLDDWKVYEGRIRLLLPEKLLKLHLEAVGKFNELGKAIFDFDPSEPEPRKKQQIFGQLEDIKLSLEEGLREYLRTESLIKPEKANT